MPPANSNCTAVIAQPLAATGEIGIRTYAACRSPAAGHEVQLSRCSAKIQHSVPKKKRTYQRYTGRSFLGYQDEVGADGPN